MQKYLAYVKKMLIIGVISILIFSGLITTNINAMPLSVETTAGATTVMETSTLPQMIFVSYLNPKMPDPLERCQLTSSEISFLKSCENRRNEKESKKTTENKADNRECNGVDAKCFFNDDSCNRQYNKNLLYSLVQAEAGNQDLDGCRLVADVVLNRIDSDRFPNELEDVIYAPGQFSVVRNGALKKAQGNVSAKVIKAVDMELSQGRLNTEILYFNNSDNGGTKYGDHYFK